MENYTGSKTLPASIKKKERHWPEVLFPSPMKKITSGDLEGGWQPPSPDQGLESFLFLKVRVLL